MFDIEGLFKEADPVRRTTIPSAHSPEGEWHYRQATSSNASLQRGVTFGPKVRIISGVGLVGVAAVVVALTIPGSPEAPTRAAAALAKLASVAADQPSATPIPVGQYAYTASVGLELVSQVHEQQAATSGLGATGASGATQQTFSVLAPVTRQVWIAADGSGRLVQSYGSPTFLTTADRAAWVADGQPSVFQPSSNIDALEAKGALSGPDLSGLPTDPDALLADIEARKVEDAPAGDAYTFKIIGDLLRETNATPALRAAIYRAAAKLPGVTLLSTVTDPVGRSGIGLADTSNGQRNELIFNPTTSALIGEETVVTDPSDFCQLDVSAGTVLSETSYVTAGVVSSTTAVPSGPPLTSFSVPVPATTTAPAGATSSNCPPTTQTTEPSVSTTTTQPSVNTTTTGPSVSTTTPAS
jgi:hypothetical protein